jgi:hypothetical protein
VVALLLGSMTAQVWSDTSVAVIATTPAAMNDVAFE